MPDSDIVIDRAAVVKGILEWFNRYGYTMSDKNKLFFDGLLEDALKMAKDATSCAIIMALIVEQQKALSRLSK